jgi:hypothetical protein
MTVIATSVACIAQAQTRYGAPPAYDSAQPAPQPMLTWPGKPAATPVQKADDRYASPQRVAPTSLYDSPPPRWRPADAASPQPPASAPTPTNPQVAGPQVVGEGLPPHFYSVARQYGVQPDPVQLSPQFLASTPQADMAEPPPIPPPHTAGPQAANMSTAAATNQLRQAQEAAADADSAALGN